jgi:hypothetical protein
MGLGLLLGTGGLAVRHDAEPARDFCHFNAEAVSFEQSFKSVGLRGLPAKAPSCSALDLRYDLGLAAALLGLVIAAVGFVYLMRRSWRANALGTPWPVRRAMDAAARWLDARVPGANSQPRLRGGYLACFSAVVLAAAVLGAGSLWQSHQRSQQARAYALARAALPSLQLPPVLKRVTGSCGGGEICAQSTLNPPQLESILRHLLHGAPRPELRALLPCPGACPVTIYGQFDGVPVVGDAAWHPVVVRNGKPPKGAVPAFYRRRPRPGRPRLWERGSEVSIGLIAPR